MTTTLKTKTTRLGQLGVVALLAACSSSSATLTLSEFSAKQAAAYCESFATCQPHGVYPEDVGVALSGACSTVSAPYVELDELIARGHIRLDQGAAETCLGEIRACRDADEVCDRALIGDLPKGAACADDAECVSRMCEGNVEACGQCAATVAPVAVGEPCDGSAQCAQLASGEVRCLLDDQGGARCTAMRTVKAGAPCDDDIAICEPGSYCNGILCSRPASVGEDCGRCERGSFCAEVDDQQRRCLPVLLRREGESCTLDFTPSSRATFEVCDLSQNLLCDDASLRCVAFSRYAEGEPCAASRDCLDGLFCDEQNTCAAPRALGEPCETARACQSSRCVDGACASGPLRRLKRSRATGTALSSAPCDRVVPASKPSSPCLPRAAA